MVVRKSGFDINNFQISRETRNSILFLVGVIGVIAELIIEQVDRPYLLAILGGFAGLPQFLKRDEALSESDKEEPHVEKD